MATNPYGIGLGFLRRVGGSGWLERLGMKNAFERVLFEGSRRGFQAGAAGRKAFKKVKGSGSAGRLNPRSATGVFDLTPTEEQEMIRDAVARYADEQLRSTAFDADRDCKAPQEVVAGAAELGLAMMMVPESLGGAASEQSPVTAALIAEALAHGDMGQAIACLAPVGVASLLSRYGTADQQAQYLPAFVGEHPPPAALAMTESRPLSDPAQPATKARSTGDGMVINGEKAQVPLVAQAQLFLVTATDENGTAQLYLVESDTPGVQVKPEPGMGVRAAGMGTLLLDNVKLSAGSQLGGTHGSEIEQVVALSRLAWCALAIGTAQAALDYVVPYINERKAFGEPISNRQGVAFLAADMLLELEGIRLATWQAAASAEQGRDCVREAALAHRLAVKHGMAIGSSGIQLLGGHGFIKEHPVERWYRDLRAVGVMHGGVSL